MCVLPRCAEDGVTGKWPISMSSSSLPSLMGARVVAVYIWNKDAVQDRCVTGTFIFFNFICQKSEYHRVPLPLLHDIAVALPQRKHGPEEA